MTGYNHYTIYRIVNLINNKIYIGQTTQDPYKRLCDHFYQANKKTKRSRYNKTPLHNAIRKYGIENFKFEPIYSCFDIDELNKRETYFILEYKSNESEFGYNCNTGGTNKLLNETTKQRMSLAASKRTANIPNGENHWAYGLTGTMLGKKHTDKSIKNILANQPDRSGKNNSSYDSTSYHWKNINGKEEFCSGYELRMKYNLRIQAVSDLKHKRKKKLNSGWYIVFD